MNILKQFILSLVVLCLFCFPTYSKDGVLDENFQFRVTELSGMSIKAIEKIQYLQNNTILIITSLVKNSNSIPIYYLLRLDENGNVDNTFLAQEISAPYFAIQSDGRIIVGKYFNGKHSIVRLQSDGSLDNLFEECSLDYAPLDIKIFRGNEIYIGTLTQLIKITSKVMKVRDIEMYVESSIIKFFEVNNEIYQFKGVSGTIRDPYAHKFEVFSRSYIRRISDELILDNRHNLDSKYPYWVNLFHDDSSIYLSGDFSEKRKVNNNYTDEMYGITKYYIKDSFPLSLSNSYDSSFNKPQGTIRGFERPATSLNGIVVNKKLLLFGNFKWYNGESKGGIVRTEKNGDIDNTFDSGSGVDGSILSISAGTNNDLFIAGNFTSYNGVPRRFIAKLKGDKQKFQYEWYNNLSIKPNPTSELCTIDNIPFGYSVRIADILGNTVSTFPSAPKTEVLSIDTRTMSSGIYFIYIQDTDGNIMSKILSVEH